MFINWLFFMLFKTYQFVKYADLNSDLPNLAVPVNKILNNFYKFVFNLSPKEKNQTKIFLFKLVV